MSVSAPEFTPFTPTEDNEEENYNEGDMGAVDQVTEAFNFMGLEAKYDPEMGGMFVKQFEDCKCCHGFINICNGVACEHLGVC